MKLYLSLLALLPFTLFMAHSSSLTAQPTSGSERPALVTVTGEASAYAKPDEVRFQFSIRTEGKDLLEARSTNSDIASKAIAYLKKQGVEARHIETQYLNVSPEYRGPNLQDPRYVAQQSISVLLQEVTSFEDINVGLLELGVTGINNPNFRSSKLEELEAEVRVAAVVNAKQKAQALAAALDQTIGQAYEIIESTAGYQPQYAMRMSAEMDSSREPSVAPGEILVKRQVTVSFYLR